MIALRPAVFCDTFADLATPILPVSSAFEFRPPRVSLNETSQRDFHRIVRFAHAQAWYFDLQRIRGFLQNPAHALIVTDVEQRIKLVSQGFESMTGYSQKEVLSKRPAFLQGPETNPETKRQIREAVPGKDNFVGQILNYRKNGEPYWCNLEIATVRDCQQEVVNYLAFEWEAAA